MLFAIKLGPIETSEGDVSAYVGFTEAGIVPPTFRRRDADGLKHLAAQVYGEELRCEPALARAGATLGYAAGPVPDWAVPMRAIMALGIGLGGQVQRIASPDLLVEFAQAAAEFWHGQPFFHWHDGQPIAVVVEGALQRRFEAALLGNAGIEYGVALYRGKGSVRRAAQAMDQSRISDAARIESLAVTLDDQPQFAIEPLQAAFGLPRFPRPVRVRRGEPGYVDEAELTALIAVLRAMAELSPLIREAHGRCVVEGVTTTARVQAPEPEGPPA